MKKQLVISTLSGLGSFVQRVSFVLAGLVATVLIAFSQERQPARGFQFANSYSSNGFDAINVSNGNVIINLPLASLPAGRGTAPGFGVTLQYNSKLWDSRQNVYTDGLPQGSQDQTPEPTYNYTTNHIEQSDRGGWKLLTGYTPIVTDRLNLETPSVCMNGDPAEKLAYRWKMEVEFPDGSIKQFVPVYGATYNYEGYYSIDHHGVNYIAVRMTTPANGLCYVYQNTTAPGTTGGMNDMTVDGSRMRLYVPYQGSNWKMYSPDGTIVEWSPPDDSTVSQRITDRNGNRVEIKGNQIVDQLGRSITLGGDGVTVKGINGESVTTSITWGIRWINRQYQIIDNLDTVPDGTDRYDTVNTSMYDVLSVTLPSQIGGQTFNFDYYADSTQHSGTDYTSGWGELKSMTLPGGAKSTYTYSLENSVTGSAKEVLDNYVTNRELTFTETYDGASTNRTETNLYSTYPGTSGVTNPDGSSSSDYTFYNFYGTFWDTGLAYKSVVSGGHKTERIWKKNLPYNSWNSYGYSTPGSGNAYVKTEFSTITDAVGNPAKTAIKDFNYDKNGNVTKIKEYDWVAYGDVPRNTLGPTGIPSSAVLKRVTVNQYHNPTPDADSTTISSNTYENASSPLLKNVLKSTEMQDGNQTPVARTEFDYDDPNNKGNLIETRVWDSTKAALNSPDYNGYKLNSTNAIFTHATYDSYGNPVTATDAKGNVTQITYGNILGPNGTVDGLYPTQTVAAYGTSIARTSTATYDFYTGAVTSTTDADNNLTNATEYDGLGRPTKSISAQGTALESWTMTTYDDINRRVVVKSDLETKGDSKKVATQFYDQLGRVRLSKTLEDSATQSATNETDGIKVQTRYLADNPYSYSVTSNPFRSATSSAATNEPTMGWTRTKGWNTGKREETETFSGSNLPAPWGGNVISTGKSEEAEELNYTTTTDESGKVKRMVEDAFGRMIRVDEPDSNGSLGNISSPNQATNYTFDTLGNLIEIVQGGQTRTFSFSSLSRLTHSTNPESGTFQHTYDENGNLLTKTDARSISTTYTYDALNRATLKNYSDSTPDIAFTYDDSQVAFSRGKLTKTASTVSETLVTAYDPQDRIVASQQRTDGHVYSFAYTYNLGDDLLTQTYPSGKVIELDYDSSGDIERVRRSNGFRYANSFVYTPHGQIEKVRLGNGRWETTQFNSDRQITQVGLGFSANDTGIWKANYEYGDWSGSTIDTQKNNGNVARQTISVPTIGGVSGFTAFQSYTYDSLDRLRSATETISGSQTWKQTFVHDRFGNRNFDSGNTTLQSVDSTVPKVVNPEILTSNNRFKLDQDNDSQNDYLYDSSGNLTKNALGRDFTYNAENLQITTTGSGLSMIYSYDGNNKRIKSYDSVNDRTTLFVYDAGGRLSAEYTINVPAPTTPVISYLTQDALGSPRVVTNSFGEVKSRRDFLPFGEELYAGLGSRATNQKYSSNIDDTRQKFTGYQRDNETGLDFAQSRYYSSMHGRFTSPDEFKGGPDELFDFEEDASSNPTFYADLTNPQSLNKYQYAYNNPYKFNDPTGHCSPCPAQFFLPIVTVDVEFIQPTFRPLPIPEILPMITRIGSVARPITKTSTIDILPTYSPFPIFRPSGRSTGAGGRVQPQARPRPNQMAKPSGKPTSSKIKGLEKQRSDHQKKLTRYSKHPYKNDNKGSLKNSPPSRHADIIRGRVRNLVRQIRNFDKQIKQVKKNENPNQ